MMYKIYTYTYDTRKHSKANADILKQSTSCWKIQLLLINFVDADIYNSCVILYISTYFFGIISENILTRNS